jgi:hypothetical protein
MLGIAKGARLTLQEQSLSFANVHPAGQHPSPPTQAVIGVPVHVPLTHELFVMHALALGHTVPSATGTPPVHAPAAQVSAVMHGVPLEHPVPSGACMTSHNVSASTQVLTRQIPPGGGQTIGVPEHTPPVQTSFVVQYTPSSQAVPSALVPLTHACFDSSQVEVWQGPVAAGHVFGVPVQIPMAHASFSVQKSPSSQSVPSITGDLTQALLTHAPTLHWSDNAAQSDDW